ncbi:glycosyltransferase [Microbacterium sp. PRC9]|uniref:glycosyltransferase n=1 Tax=Microbacterium sp. PRC9 TaxID=2962591 RepID=UPI002881E804|nr:glycosyltransferase [Microbacterium sp. PRC9]MDT0141089.1 glycosyltransferase [Microbacterium sp. PRC9]
MIDGAQVLWRTVLPSEAEESPASLYLRGAGDCTWSRDRVVLGEGATVSFATYFGAFPSGYWRHWTGLASVRLEMDVDGSADIVVRRTNAHGEITQAARMQAASGIVSLDIRIDTDDEGGWLWLEAAAPSGRAELRSIAWCGETPVVRPGTATVCVTTFDREADCIALLARLGRDETVKAAVERIVVVDQGTRRLAEAEGFSDVAQTLGDRLRLERQPNLGGSGGFSRGMVETVEGESTPFVLLLDDDVRIEPESVLRLLEFGRRTLAPAIVGGHMLSLVDPTRLHSFGERVAARGFWWEPVDPTLSGIDLAVHTIDRTPQLSRRIEVDFNGWWMCLVPASLVRDHGASLPYFIKWDDAEFGLRAAASGVRTVSLPGAAIWHMPWTAKDDGLDWQAYFQLRNRVVTALLHGGRGVLAWSLAQDVNHIICAQYGSARLRNTALRDILSGPGHLEPVLRAGPARAAAILSQLGQRPVERGAAPPAERVKVARPSGLGGAAVRAARVLMHQLRRGNDGRHASLRRQEGKWWAIGLLDLAVVDSASGNGVFVFQRDRSRAIGELKAAVAARWKLWWRWRRLARTYRAAAPGSSSARAWRSRFSGEAPTSP